MSLPSFKALTPNSARLTKRLLFGIQPYTGFENTSCILLAIFCLSAYGRPSCQLIYAILLFTHLVMQKAKSNVLPSLCHLRVTSLCSQNLGFVVYEQNFTFGAIFPIDDQSVMSLMTLDVVVL
jgi:hypothetical protein